MVPLQHCARMFRFRAKKICAASRGHRKTAKIENERQQGHENENSDRSAYF